MSMLNNLKKYVKGEINESAIITGGAVEVHMEDEDAFIQECTELCMGIILQSELMNEDAGVIEDTINETYVSLQSYLVGQGIISESTIAVSNPKINFVRLNKQAQLERIKKIVILKLARKRNTSEYKKYKIGTALKRDNMIKMVKMFGSQAERLATQIWNNAQRNKVKAVVDVNKEKMKSKTAKGR